MKVYIAASSAPSERARVDAAFAGCRAAGIEVVGDWRESVDASGANPKDLGLARAAANADLGAIEKCVALWLLVPEAGGCGCWVELGAALESARHFALPVVVASGDVSRSVFLSLCYKRFASDLEALRYLVERKDMVSP